MWHKTDLQIKSQQAYFLKMFNTLNLELSHQELRTFETLQNNLSLRLLLAKKSI